MKREQILLVAVVALLALLALTRFTGGSDYRAPRSADLPLELGELTAEDAVVPLGGAKNRDPFREPRDEEPLEPLVLPLPPVPPIEAVLPPPLPDSGPDHWSDHLLALPAPLPGGLDELIDLQALAPAAADEAGEAGSGASLGGETDYAESYDSVRLNSITVLYGRLLGDDRHDKQRGDTILFQEVDPRTGQDRFAPRELAGGQYESFAFARQLRNEIELKVRALAPSPAGLVERIELVRWLLDQGAQEPAALDHAVRLARQGTQLAPDDISSWMALGEAWERTFRFDEAVALYGRMAGLELPPGAPALDLPLDEGRFARYSAPRTRVAVVLLRLGLQDEAAGLLEEAVALNDGNPSALLELGLLLHAGGRAEEAVPLLRRAFTMHAARSSSEALRNGLALGRAHLAMGEWEAAQQVFAETARAAVASPLAPGLAAGETAALYLAGRFDEAAAMAGQAVEDHGSVPQLLYLRGITGGAAGAPAAEVVLDLRNAAAAAPLDGAPALAALSFWLEVQGEAELADQALADALELDPGLDYALYLRGRRAARSGDLQGAADDFRTLLRRAPHFAAALVELGWVLHQDRRYEAAEVALRRATQDAPDWAGASLFRALNHLLRGAIDEARAALADAQAGATGLPVVRNALGWAANAENDLQAAIAEFSFMQDVLREDEENPQFQYASTWQGRLALHARMRRWADEFDGRLLRPGWEADARFGVEPRVLDGRLEIRGSHREAGRTRATRQVPGMNFIGFAADLTVGSGHRGEAGLQLSLERGRRSTWEFRIYRDRDGGLRWYSKQGSREARGEAGRLPAGSPVRVELSLDREQLPPVLSVTAGGREVYSQPVPALRSASMPLLVGVYAQTPNALPVEVALDNVELLFLSNQ